MANYPSAIDDASSLYSPADAFSAKPLDTTATQQILAGDSTVSVASTDGFAPTYGILSINDELIIYTAKNATQFTGCQRGAFGTSAAQHASGVAVKANMVSGFLTALQSAVLAIENEVGVASARNYVRKDGAVTITGLKTFVDGAEFGAGAKAATGLVRLPNDGALRWRKADNSGNLGMSLNAANHVAMEAIIDFAVGQTFGAFSYPDATTGSKGIVQIDAVGGIAVNAGVISLANSGATPGTHTKVTVDAKGRVTTGAFLSAGDLPSHTHVAGDIVSGAFGVPRGGTGLPTIAANKLLYSPAQDTLAELSIGSGLLLAAGVLSLGSHSHAESEVTGLMSDLAARPLKGLGFAPSRAAVINSSGAIDGALGNTGDCVLVDGTSAAKSNASHTHPAADIVSGTLALARGGTGADLSASGPGFLRQDAGSNAVTVGSIALADLPAELHQYGPFQTIGGDLENMVKRSEDFSTVWSTDGGSCSVAANTSDTLAPDGNQTADKLTSNADAAKIQQQVAGLTDGGTYTFYVWAVILEKLTVEGPVDLTAAEEAAVRYCRVNARFGIIANRKPGAKNCYIADNIVTYTMPWIPEAMGSESIYRGPASIGEGIQMTGPGNVIRHNRVKGYRDCISTMEDTEAFEQISVDIYNNDIEVGGDDAIEADFCMGNCRVMRNRITNCFMGLNSQPSLGGPIYFIRNAMYNIIEAPFKLERGSAGNLFLHNTVVKAGDGLRIPHGPCEYSNTMLRNNLAIGGLGGGKYGRYPNGTGRPIYTPETDPSGAILFSGIEQLRRLTTERHAVQVDMSVFEGVEFPYPPVPERRPPALRLRHGSPAVDAGIRLPNVNDGFTGAAPDLGAHELGRPLPHYGPRPEGMDEETASRDGRE